MAKTIIVLDVEGMSGKRPYDIGYIIADFKGNVFVERSFACLPCVWENLSNSMKTALDNVREMTHRNIKEILEKPDKYNWSTIEEIRTALIDDVLKYKVSEIWAYNCSFDKSMMTHLFDDDTLTKINCDWLDIWSAIVVTKCLTKKYVKFCKENGFLTEKGNCKTSAEVVYAYLTKNIDFCEEHTGLNDAKIEYEILLMAKKTKKKIDGTLANPWKLVKKFCEVNGL